MGKIFEGPKSRRPELYASCLLERSRSERHAFGRIGSLVQFWPYKTDKTIYTSRSKKGMSIRTHPLLEPWPSERKKTIGTGKQLSQAVYLD